MKITNLTIIASGNIKQKQIDNKNSSLRNYRPNIKEKNEVN